jgi:hypothetical protein
MSYACYVADDLLSLNAGIKTKDEAYSREADSSPSTNTVTGPNAAGQPSFRIDGSLTLGSCDDLSITGVLISCYGGRPPASIVWTIDGVTLTGSCV